MNKKWMDNRKQDKIRVMISIGLTTLLLLLLGAAGTIRNGKAARISESQGTKSQETKSQGAESQRTESDRMLAARTVLPEVSEETPVPEISLTPEDQDFLNQLTEQIGLGDLDGAARTLNGYKVPWREFPLMYDGTAMKAEVSSGYGLVFTKASTVFYGKFDQGVPQGNCTALQVLELEEGKRYDYAWGTWEKGKMSGNGECGYNYYDGVKSDITKVNAKKGTFKEDLMQGEITYTSTNTAGETTSWQFQVADGVIVPDDRWIRDTDSSGAVIYRLMAKDDDIHAYTLSESAMGEDRWKNLIVYEAWKAGG